MDTPPSNGFVLEIWHMVIGVIGFGLTWAWKFVTGDIRRLRDTTVTKDDFQQFMEASTKQRDELRDAVIDLYKGQKEMTETINKHHLDLLTAIHEIKSDHNK